MDGQIVHEVVKHERMAAAAHGRLRTFLKERGLLKHDDRRPEDIAIALIQNLEQDNLDLRRVLGDPVEFNEQRYSEQLEEKLEEIINYFGG